MKNAMLSDKQKKAAAHGAGAAMVLSGAGSGKTRVLCGRYQHLRAGKQVPGEGIVALAPNTRAAAKMEERIGTMLPDGIDMGPHGVETFPAFCNRVLRTDAETLGYGANYTVYDEDDRFGLIRSILKEFKIHEALFRGIAARIAGLKARMITPEDFLRREGGFGFEEKLARVYLRYQEELRRNNAMDAGDLICQAVRLLEEHEDVAAVLRQSVDHVLVDDFQDITPAQYALVRLLAGGGARVFVAADDDQGILGHRGARLEFIDRFSKDFAKTKIYRLERSYRCTPCILDAADAIVRDNAGRRRKTIRSDRDPGQKPRYFHAGSEAEEAAYIVGGIRELYFAGRYAYKDFAILYRMNSQLKPLEEALRLEGVPYRIRSNRAFFHRSEIRDALAYLRIVVNPADTVSLKRIVNTPPRGMGESTLAKMAEAARTDDRSFFDTLRAASRTRKSLARARKLVELVVRLRRKETDAGEVLAQVLAKSGYLNWLEQEKNGAERVGNVRRLIDMAASRNPTDFLDDVVVQRRHGSGDEPDVDAVSVMTVYEARGLQFPVVYMPGLEEGVLPRVQGHHESRSSLEEERRLLYVGMTRARDILFLSGAARRRLYSRIQPQKPSRFLADLDEKLCSVVERAPAAAEKGEPLPRHSVHDLSDGTPFPVGARVRHVTWGAGVVRDYIGQGESAKVTVNFPGVGVKRLALKFANLEVLA